ncbi:MAG: hypothetical protein ABEJ25_06615 [Candidatus Bipolaricaulia bacterium]
MSELKTVDDLELDYSKSQLYWRINKLVESDVMNPPERGQRNQYLLTPEDVELLKKLSEAEKSKATVKKAIAELKKEDPTEDYNQELPRRVAELEERTSSLEEKVEMLETKLSLQDDRLQKFRDRWTQQLKEGAKKVKDLFG